MIIRDPAWDRDAHLRVGEFASLRRKFYQRYRPTAGDLARFEMLLDEMFDVFKQADASADGRGWGWPILPTADNLDTGAASAEPSAQFLEHLTAALEDSMALRHYVGPRPIAALTAAVRGWLTETRVVPARVAENLDVAVGSGTVNLWDSILRVLIEQQEDIVLLPDATYGFFLPQAERRGGRTAVLPFANWHLDPERHLGGWIDECNRVCMQRWRSGLRERCIIYGLDLGRDRSEAEAFGDQALALEEDRSAGNGLYAELCHLSTERFFGGDHNAFADAQSRPGTRLSRAGRVRAFLLINPNTYGAVYDHDTVDRLAACLRRRGVTLIEDWAYHSLGVKPEEIGTKLGEPGVLLLLGISKPLGVADCRIGLLLGSRGSLTPIYRAVENSVGFVSTRVQIALAATLSNSAQVRAECEANWCAERGYDFQRRVGIAAMKGFCTEDSDANLLNWARAYLLTGQPNNGVPPLVRTLISRLGDQGLELVEKFLRIGLREYFEIPQDPRAGFFIVADCAPVLASPPYHLRHELHNSFDVFAAMAYFFGVRTIPEECLGRLDFQCGRLIRFSYSVRPEFLLQSLFTVFCGFHILDK